MPPRPTTRISPAERDVLAVLWEKAPRTTAEIVERLSATKGWAPRTVRTLLARLVRKRALQLDTRERPHLFHPRLDRDACLARESRNLLDGAFGGEPASMLISLVREADLTPDQIAELKRILEQKEH